jgi:hypothetical protein
MSAKLKELHKKCERVLDPLLTVNYTSYHNRFKHVIFHRPYPTIRNVLSDTKKLDENRQKLYAFQLLTNGALQRGTHNYLNPGTIFINQDNVLLIGGMEYFSVGPIPPIISPTTDWSAPEYCRHAVSYTNKAQVWSIGAILWCMQHGSLDVPFTAEMSQDQVSKIISEDLLLTPRWRPFISALLINDPTLRPDMFKALILFRETFPFV